MRDDRQGERSECIDARKADRSWIAVEVVEPQRLPLDQDDLEQPVANGNRSDPLPLLGGDARGEECFDPPPSRRRESAVAGADEVAGTVDDLLQDGLEVELTENAEPASWRAKSSWFCCASWVWSRPTTPKMASAKKSVPSSTMPARRR